MIASPEAGGLSGPFRFHYGISVFFPAYNDAPSLPELLARTFETLERFCSDYEVIVVNDGSADDTGAVLEQLATKYAPYLRVVTHPENRGYGAALRSGFTAASKEFIFYTDGDGQYDPRELEKLLRAAGPDTGLVNGYKMERNDPWHRIAIGWLYNQFARWLFRIKLRDIDCDFRLMRRGVLDPEHLQSTGGTICVELVRTLEMSGYGVVEVPVHHYARQHGRSQFFRLQSLAVTFLQLCAVFTRMVLLPALFGAEERKRPSRRRWFSVFVIGALLSVTAYGWALRLPFISDDYIQIQLARDYGPWGKWPDLFADALYRCRATSLWLTYGIDKLFGLQPVFYNATSLGLHLLNVLLVFALGSWRLVGWRLSTLAACIFAITQRSSEAVVWFAAVPELLVFSFVLGGFLFFVHWLEQRKLGYYVGALLCFVLALLSKESGVALVPLCGLAWALTAERKRTDLLAVAPFAGLAAAYFAASYAARDTHLHFNDGTFSLSAPFVQVLVNSTARMIWFWGLAMLPLFAMREGRRWRVLLLASVAWMVVALLPYSFLTYMPRVPSRHTYLASVGRALLIGSALLILAEYGYRRRREWLAPLAASVLFLHQATYLWTVKYPQYANRAEPTEQLLRAGRQSAEVHAKCFPYSPIIAESALRLRELKVSFHLGPKEGQRPDSLNFCNEDADGVHY